MQEREYSVLRINPACPELKSLYDEYFHYFKGKRRAGLVEMSSGIRLYLVPFNPHRNFDDALYGVATLQKTSDRTSAGYVGKQLPPTASSVIDQTQSRKDEEVTTRDDEKNKSA